MFVLTFGVMTGRAVELNVAGQSCRVVSTASEEELQSLAQLVEDKLSDVLPDGRPLTTRAVLLAAVALAHDAMEQRARADAIAHKATTTLDTMLGRVDSALESSDVIAKEREGRRRTKKGSSRSEHAGGDDGQDH